ncbi:MAG: hypothetical protein E6K22_13610 [Gammaproteobacteria bacterium]|nr:MAG: hypothetical protein E6K22_13610 [Gammaproteobacteria bacterium]TLZ60176.1 MAG: hypothetical protein E6K20_13370 [Gammaproteobacteria bacterium]
MSATPSGSQQLHWLPVALGGLFAGALDLTFAFIFYGYRYPGTGPGFILRTIASGVLGHEAFTLGVWTLALGAALHFFIAQCAAWAFYLASRWLGVLRRRPVSCGAAFGVAMYLVMHLVVLPLSQVRPRVPPVADVVGELFSHVFLFGIVIALAVARVTTTEVRRRAGVS